MISVDLIDARTPLNDMGYANAAQRQRKLTNFVASSTKKL